MPKTKKTDRSAAMRELRRISAEMKMIIGRMKTPRIRWAWDCPARPKWTMHDGTQHVGSYTNRAHTHVEKRNKGVICISPSWILGNKEWSWTHRSNWPILIAHEMTHIRFPKMAHRTPMFDGEVRWLVAEYNRIHDEAAIRLIMVQQ